MAETGDVINASAVNAGNPAVLLSNNHQLIVPTAVVQNDQPATTQAPATNSGENVDDYDALVDMSGNPC